MRKFNKEDKIMGISTDMLGIRIVCGKIEEVVENGINIRYIVDNGRIYGQDTLYDDEAVELNSWKLAQATEFFNEADRLEKKANELRGMAKTIIYLENTK